MKTHFYTILCLCITITGSLYAQNETNRNRKEISMKYHMYVAVSGDKKLLRYDMDPDSGDLTLIEEIPQKAALARSVRIHDKNASTLHCAPPKNWPPTALILKLVH